MLGPVVIWPFVSRKHNHLRMWNWLGQRGGLMEREHFMSSVAQSRMRLQESLAISVFNERQPGHDRSSIPQVVHQASSTIIDRGGQCCSNW